MAGAGEWLRQLYLDATAVRRSLGRRAGSSSVLLWIFCRAAAPLFRESVWPLHGFEDLSRHSARSARRMRCVPGAFCWQHAFHALATVNAAVTCQVGPFCPLCISHSRETAVSWKTFMTASCKVHLPSVAALQFGGIKCHSCVSIMARTALYGHVLMAA